MATTIRAATAEDAPSLQVLRQQAMEAGFTDHYRRAAFAKVIATPDDRVADWIAADDTLVLVGETDITPVCFGVYEVPTAHLLALYTAPEYQTEGWASALLDRFEHRTRRDGHARLEATVPLNAVGFFQRRGFERQHATERDGLSMVVVAKPLDR